MDRLVKITLLVLGVTNVAYGYTGDSFLDVAIGSILLGLYAVIDE